MTKRVRRKNEKNYQFKVKLGIDRYFEGHFLETMAKKKMHRVIIINSVIHLSKKQQLRQDKAFFTELMYKLIRERLYIKTPEDLIKIVEDANLEERMNLEIRPMKSMIINIDENNSKLTKLFISTLEKYEGLGETKQRTLALAIDTYLNSGNCEEYVIFRVQELLVKTVKLYKDHDREIFWAIFNKIKN